MKKRGIFNVFITAITFCLCVSIAYLLSSTIVSASGGANFVAISKQKVYALSFQTGTKTDDFSVSKFELQSKGGAGYLYERDEKIFLLASVYENQTDAKKVKQNLASSGVSSSVIEISLSSTKISGTFSSDEKEVLLKAIKSDFEIYQKLYDISISLDTLVCDLSKAKLDCSDVYANLVSTKSNFESFFKSKLSDETFSKIQENLEKSEEFLSNLVGETKDTKSQSFSSLIKLTYCKILFE